MSATLFEQYRPQTFADVVGQDKAVATINRLQSRGGLNGRAYLLTGQSGTGKTTIARLIAREVAEDYAVTEYADPSELTADELRKIKTDVQSRPLGRGYCFIVNECHALRSDQIAKLLGLIETLPSWITWIFTTTTEASADLFGELDGPPFFSRCLRLDLARRDLTKPFAERVRMIAQLENLDGKPIEQYVRLLQSHRNNLRAALSAVEAGVMLD